MAALHIKPFDCHTHTRFSDGASAFAENVRAAAEKGCRVLVSTDHLTLPASMDPTSACPVAEADLPAHRRAFEAARELAHEIAPGLELVYGFECDWYEGCEPFVGRRRGGAARERTLDRRPRRHRLGCGAAARGRPGLGGRRLGGERPG